MQILLPTRHAKFQVVSLPEFEAASALKVSSDIGQKQIRYLALRGGKVLVTPQPRLQSGFFSVLEPETLDPKLYQEVATAAGVAKYARHLGLGARFKVDLVIVGSVAVDPSTGARLGEGEGLTDLEYGFLRLIGAIDDSTVIVTSVHDKQLVNDIPVGKLAVHDFPVDVICTPTQIIRTNTTIAKPKGIFWEMLSPEKFVQFRILQELRRRIEQDTGQRLMVGGGERPSLIPERSIFPQPSPALRPNSVQPFPKQGLFIWCFDDLVTPEELKTHLDKLGISVVKVDVFPKKGPVPAMARALLPGGEDIDRLVAIVDKSDLRGQLIRCQVDKAYEPQTYGRRMR
ncbi:hypothetical protein O6H91_17G034500 [Diphasiastrum complanatum]|uniref:Uncharacterized protein n=1 Tax=Diphasiastrum complanatum TaxID=34168 RepID=A0ACC2B5N6_DIPCM|nr:hypothetical protein O6H91_17G034500 [Diphasiastrum complanatum]